MVRLLTYNIHGCRGRSGQEDPEAIMEVLSRSEADVVALQEVFDRDGDFTERLYELGFETVTSAWTMKTSRGAYGNILAARVTPTEVQKIDLHAGGVEPRSAIRFHLDLPDGPIDICGTHLGLSARERLTQLRKLDSTLADADQRNEDALQVLMGDFNEWRPRTQFMRVLRNRFSQISRQPTFPARRPLLSLDRIAVRGMNFQARFRRVDTPPAHRASDHRPLLAELEFPR